MITSSMALLAEMVIVDATTNSVSLIGLIEEYGAVSFPMVIPRMTVFFQLEKEPTEPSTATLSLRIDGPTGTAARFPVNVDFLGKNRNRLILGVDGLTIGSEGKLQFMLEDGDREIARSSISISKIAQPPTPVIMIPQKPPAR